MKGALKHYVCRVRAYQSGWTIEAYPCGSGGWWFDGYDAYSGTKLEVPAERHSTFRKALLAGMKIAKATRLPQKTIDYNSGQM